MEGGMAFCRWRVLVSALLAVALVVITEGAREGQLSAYQKAVFRGNPDKELNHFLISSASGTEYVYIGGESIVILLDTDLNHIRNETVTPSTCDIQCNNPNHILAVAPAPTEQLIFCKGGDGFCELRNLTGLSLTALDHEYTVKVTIPGSDKRFVGVVAPIQNVEYFFVGSSIRNEDEPKYPIRQRNIDPDGFTFNYERRTAMASSTVQFDFLQAFIWRGFVFFALNVRPVPPVMGHSSLGRLCLQNTNDLPDGDSLSQYMEVILSCSLGELKYTHVGPAGLHLAASLGIEATDDLLYAVFSDGTQSALCYYTMDEIQEKFLDAAYGCSSENADVSLAQPIDYFIDDALCTKDYPLTRAAIPGTVECTATVPGYTGVTVFKYAQASAVYTGYNTIDPVNGLASSVITMTKENQTVAFMLTSEGNLHKIHIERDDSSRIYETVDLGVDNVLSDIHLDENKEELYILTAQELIKLDIINCAQYNSCDTCIGPTTLDGDPFCGWCTLEATCTRRGQCPRSTELNMWLTYNDECIAILNVDPPYEYIQEGPMDVTFYVESLPELDVGQSYACQFDEVLVSTDTTRSPNFTCQTPAVADRPVIAAGEDFTTMTLGLYNSQTDKVFVEQEYPFYDCAAITGCLPCVTSRWGCEWCVYTYTCSHQSASDCNADDEIVPHNDRDRCPKMDAMSSEVLIPVGFERDITLRGQNLPSATTSYQCLVYIPEKEVQQVPARRTNSTTVFCMMANYGYDSSDGTLMLKVSVRVEYNPGSIIDDEYSNTVTLYDCSAVRSSCSSCIAPSVRPELTCGWCEATDDCLIQGDVCPEGQYLNQSNNSVCPVHSLTDFTPRSGPIDGNTTVTIEGTDLGKEIGDVVYITVSGLECDHTRQDLTYKPGVSVQCVTSESPSVQDGVINVTIARTRLGNREENLVMSSGQYSYKDPTLNDFTPTLGIQGGGTLVQVTGTDLDIGNGRQVVIGGADCEEVPGSLTANNLECRTGAVPSPGNVSVSIRFDAGQRMAPGKYLYAANPRVIDFNPKSSVSSGGIEVIVEGRGFQIAQTKQMIIDGTDIVQECYEEDSNKDTRFRCLTPQFNSSQTTRRRRAAASPVGFHFEFDGFADGTREVSYCPDPYYDPISSPIQIEQNQGQLELEGGNLDCNDLGSEYIEVCIGTGRGRVIHDQFTDTKLVFLLPADSEQPGPGGCDGEPLDDCASGLPCIVVRHGMNLNFTVASVRWPDAPVNVVPIIIGCVVGIVGLLVVIFLLFALVSRRMYVMETSKIKKQMDEFIEMSRGQVIGGFFRDQEMSDIEEQLNGLGMPFVSNQDYMKSMLFFGLSEKPQMEDPNNPSEVEERAMMDFSKLLGKKEFLMVFIRTLDQCKELTTKDKANIASLLTVVLVMEGKFRYLTDVLTSLMSETISDASDRRRLKQLFKRTETIEDKLLTNWIALAMFKFVKESVGHPLYMLYQAIKIHCEKGPVDAITGESYYSLNFENLLTENCEFSDLSLVVQSELGEEEVKVLDVDTITQVKEKILDAMYRRKHTKYQRNARDVDLVIRSGGAGQLVLSDKDNTTHPALGWCELNSLKHYGINSGTEVSLTTRQDVPNSMAIPLNEETENLFNDAPGHSASTSGHILHEYRHVQDAVEAGVKLFHLTQKYDDEIDEEAGEDGCCAKTKRLLFFNVSHQHREIKEIYLQRLITVQQCIQKFVDEALNAMFSIREDEYVNSLNNIPFALRFLFNYFDEEASRYEDGSDTSFTWKNNTLPLRFWATILAHPSFIFNMRQSRTADASVIVLNQMLDSACKGVVPKLKMNASPSRLMFNKDIQRYIDLISTYYHNIKQTPVLQEDELKQECRRIDQEFEGLFSRLATLKQLYNFIYPLEETLVEALLEDEHCKAARFASSLERIKSTLEDS